MEVNCLENHYIFNFNIDYRFEFFDIKFVHPCADSPGSDRKLWR